MAGRIAAEVFHGDANAGASYYVVANVCPGIVTESKRLAKIAQHVIEFIARDLTVGIVGDDLVKRLEPNAHFTDVLYDIITDDRIGVAQLRAVDPKLGVH